MSKRNILSGFVVLRVGVCALVSAVVVIVRPAHAQGPIVDPDVKVNDSKGRDGADVSPACCWDPDPGARLFGPSGMVLAVLRGGG